jgi:Zn-dependent M28 family amino/carboxypeptidase
MDGRRIGTAGNIRARAYILRQFLAAGLSPFGQRFTHPFTVSRPGGPTAGPPGGTMIGTNLIGYHEGTKHPDRYLVVSAHYDHLGNRNGAIYNGADDNASGTAGVLAIARWLKDNPPENSVIIVLFDGEEAGLLGSLEFVAHPPVALDRIFANVNLDMVGRNVKGELWAAGATPWIVMQPLLDGLIGTAPVILKLGHDSGKGKNDWTQQSDQGPFHTARIPWVYFGVEDHADYHQPGDTFAKIEPGFFVHSVRTIAEFVRRLDQGFDAVVAAKARGPIGP